MYVRIHAVPGAKRELVSRRGPDRYDMSVRESAERGLANARIRELVAREFGVSAKSVRLISGHQSPHKIFSVPDPDGRPPSA